MGRRTQQQQLSSTTVWIPHECDSPVPDSAIAEPRGPLAALSEHIDRRLRTPEYRHYFRQVLDGRADLFTTAPGPWLCQQDLNPYNLLFELRDGEPVLTGVLDFETRG